MTPIVRARDFPEWRSAARSLLAREVPPDAITWVTDDTEPSLFEDAAVAESTRPASPAATLRLPRGVLDMLETAAMFRGPDRWAFLYRVVWRWRRDEFSVISAADADGARLHRMVKAVRRCIHDMHAYLRFREQPPLHDGPRFVAWYEPEHDILRPVAQHFAQRMGSCSWLIATPQGIVAWNGERLEFGPAAERPPTQADLAEALWLTYYRNTFNPARLNTAAMQSHMPQRHWKNLPEAQLIPQLVTEAETAARGPASPSEVVAKHGTRRQPAT